MNNRLNRLLAEDAIGAFLRDVESGQLEQIRQSALYADVGSHGPLLPASQLDEKSAEFYTVLAGELLADVLGVAPLEWERLLAKVQAYEKSIGHAWK